MNSLTQKSKIKPKRGEISSSSFSLKTRKKDDADEHVDQEVGFVVKKGSNSEVYRDPSQLSSSFGYPGTPRYPQDQRRNFFSRLFCGFNFFSSSSSTSTLSRKANRIQPIEIPDQKKVAAERKKSQLRRSAFNGAYPRRVYTEGWDSKLPCAVIVTIHSNGSFDKLFRAISQQSPDPNYSIAVFEMDYETISDFLCYFTMDGGYVSNLVTKALIQQVVDEIQYVDPSSVLFNFECCNFCPRQEFQEMGEEILEFVHCLLERGYMAMFSDFSLKSLLTIWDKHNHNNQKKQPGASLLGPNPFQQIGSCESHVDLVFDIEKLQSCGSAQLQNVALMNASEGICTAKIKCMPNTIMYTLVDEEKLQETHASDYYNIEVLSIVTGCGKRRILDPSKHFKIRTLYFDHQQIQVPSHLQSPSQPSSASPPALQQQPQQEASLPFSSITGNLDPSVIPPAISCSSASTAIPNHHQQSLPTNIPFVDAFGSLSTTVTPTHHQDNNTTDDKTNKKKKNKKISGYAGHVMLEYKSGGKLLLSAAHWIDLNHIDTKNKTGLLQVVEKMYGVDYAKEVKSELQSASSDKEMEALILQRSAKQIIQSAAPCGYSMRRGSIGGGIPPTRRPSMLSASFLKHSSDTGPIGYPPVSRSSLSSVAHLIPPLPIASMANSTVDEEDDYNSHHDE